jgi:hypothetical protein
MENIYLFALYTSLHNCTINVTPLLYCKLKLFRNAQSKMSIVEVDTYNRNSSTIKSKNVHVMFTLLTRTIVSFVIDYICIFNSLIVDISLHLYNVQKVIRDTMNLPCLFFMKSFNIFILGCNFFLPARRMYLENTLRPKAHQTAFVQPLSMFRSFMTTPVACIGSYLWKGPRFVFVHIYIIR